MTNKQSINFQYGERELWLGVHDILTAPVETIVSPMNQDLVFNGGLAEQVLDKAGEQLQHDCEQLIAEHGTLESGMAVYTDAGQLPYKAVIHAVGPTMGHGDEQKILELVVSRSLQLCEINEWRSIALPAIGTGGFGIPVEISAQALFKSILSFWDARHECPLEKVMICLTEESLQPFFTAFRNESDIPEDKNDSAVIIDNDQEHIGFVELDEEETEKQVDDDSRDWFV